MKTAIFYNSSDIQQSLSAAIFLNSQPGATLYDLNGVSTSDITTLIGTITNLTLDIIWVPAVINNSPTTGEITNAQKASLDGKLSGATDTACRIIVATSTFPTFKSQSLNAWLNVYPNVVPPELVRLLSGFNLFTKPFTGTATSGATTTLTDSGATFGTLASFGSGTASGGSNTTLVDTFASGTASSGSTTTLVSSGTFTGLTGQTIYITGGTGAGQSAVITSVTNTDHTANFAAITTAPDSTSTYVVGWATNYLAGMYLNITSGTGALQTIEIISNTYNTITFAGLPVALDSTSAYSILTTTLAGNYLKIVGGTDDGEIRKILMNTVTKIWVTSAYLTAIDSTSDYEVTDYINQSDALKDYYLPLFLTTYMANPLAANSNPLTGFLGSQDSYSQLLDQLKRLGAGGNGNTLPSQNLTYLNNVVMPQAIAIYIYVNPS